MSAVTDPFAELTPGATTAESTETKEDKELKAKALKKEKAEKAKQVLKENIQAFYVFKKYYVKVCNTVFNDFLTLPSSLLSLVLSPCVGFMF